MSSYKEGWHVYNDVQKESLVEHITNLPTPFRLEFKKASRTLSQNNLFHMWVREVTKFFISKGKTTWASGEEMSEPSMKENLKETFLGCQAVEKVDLRTGEVRESVETRHTSKLDKGEFYHFMTLIDEWASNFGVKLTRPEDSEYMNMRRDMGESV